VSWVTNARFALGFAVPPDDDEPPDDDDPPEDDVVDPDDEEPPELDVEELDVEEEELLSGLSPTHAESATTARSPKRFMLGARWGES